MAIEFTAAFDWVLLSKQVESAECFRQAVAVQPLSAVALGIFSPTGAAGPVYYIVQQKSKHKYQPQLQVEGEDNKKHDDSASLCLYRVPDRILHNAHFRAANASLIDGELRLLLSDFLLSEGHPRALSPAVAAAAHQRSFTIPLSHTTFWSMPNVSSPRLAKLRPRPRPRPRPRLASESGVGAHPRARAAKTRKTGTKAIKTLRRLSGLHANLRLTGNASPRHACRVIRRTLPACPIYQAAA